MLWTALGIASRVPGRAGALTSAARDFAAAPSGQTAWSLGGQVVGVIGPDKFINAAIRYAGGLAARTGELDKAAAEEIVALAKSRAPRLSGLLAAEIEAHQVGAAWVVTSTAQLYGNTADYAPFVEFGTAAGKRGRRVTTEDYYGEAYSGRRGSLNEATGRRRRLNDARRRAYREHPGTDPQPYFVPSYREVMARRGVALEAISDEAATQEDLL